LQRPSLGVLPREGGALVAWDAKAVMWSRLGSAIEAGIELPIALHSNSSEQPMLSRYSRFVGLNSLRLALSAVLSDRTSVCDTRMRGAP
jgi:hypothetical protein